MAAETPGNTAILAMTAASACPGASLATVPQSYPRARNPVLSRFLLHSHLFSARAADL